MPDTGWLWALFTVIAAAGQTVRNATQRELTTALGTVGATHVRFLFGFPFALVFLAGVLIVTGQAAAAAAGGLLALGRARRAGAQIAATALMLAAMNDRSFVVTIAYIKTEPVQAALFGLIFLGDRRDARHGGGDPDRDRRRGRDVAQARARWRAASSRRCSACRWRDVRAVGGRLSRCDPVASACRAIVHGGDLHDGGRACCMQAALLSLYLRLRDPAVLTRDRAGLAAVAVGRLHGRAGVAVLVPRLRACERRQRPHARAGRGAVRAGDLALRLQAGDDRARGARYGADRARRVAAIWTLGRSGV